jgi:RHS repeat-associated protein
MKHPTNRLLLSQFFTALLLLAAVTCSKADRPERPAPASGLAEIRQAVLLPPAPLALLVVGQTALVPGDTALQTRLTTNLGFAVSVVSASAATAADANGKALVVISESVTDTQVNTKFRSVAAPVLVLEPLLFDDMGLTLGTVNSDFGTQSGQTQVVITGAGHPMAAGLSGTRVVTTAAQPIGWGVPASSAVKVATIANAPSQFAVFGYPTGATMASSFVAPGRRVGWFGSAAAMAALAPDGWLLFDAAVKWTTRPEAVLVTASATLTAGETAMRTRLQGPPLNMDVRTMVASAVTAAASVAPSQLVLLSDGVAASVGTALVDVAIPIMSMSAGTFGTLQLTGGTSGTDFGTLTGQTRVDIAADGHPLTGALTGQQTLTTSAQTFQWGSSTAAGAIKVATIVGNTSQAAIFAYAQGVLRKNNSPAPARRVGWWASSAALASTVPTTTAWSLFDTTVSWAISPMVSVTVTVQDMSTPPVGQPGLRVFPRRGGTTVGVSALTNNKGQAFVELAPGPYNFTTTYQGLSFVSGPVDSCTTPSPCSAAQIEVPKDPIVVSVEYMTGGPVPAGRVVGVHNQANQGIISFPTDSLGQARFWLPRDPAYRFYTNDPAQSFWSDPPATPCAVPGCTTARIEVPKDPVIVTVVDPGGIGMPGISVGPNDHLGAGGLGNVVTNAQGQATFWLPRDPSWRFYAFFGGGIVWSDSAVTCPVPGCLTATIRAPGVTCQQGTAPSSCPVAWYHPAPPMDYRAEYAPAPAAPVACMAAGPVGDPAGGEGSAMPLGIAVGVGGYVDPLRWSFVQRSVDFKAAPTSQGGASQCGSLLGGGLDGLEIRRIHRPRAEDWPSSFGLGVFSNFDAKLTVRPQGGAQNAVLLFDPESDGPPVTFAELSSLDNDATVDGRYGDAGARAYAGLVLQNASGTVVPDPFLATRAVATRQTGEQLTFELINVQGAAATELQGRLISMKDRNGNALSVTYRFAASSTDTQLGGDRAKLWHINTVSDMHGVAATFNYVLFASAARWGVASINMPDGNTPQYHYGFDSADADRLVDVVYPNGDTSRFSKTWDATTQTWGLSFKDAGGGDGALWKTVYVSGTSFTTPDNVVHSQSPNMVRRVVNAAGEQLYEASEDRTSSGIIYYREGTKRLTRIKLDASGTPQEVARATSMVTDPSTAAYVAVETYTANAQGMIQTIDDAALVRRVLGRDQKTGAIKTITARDTSSVSYVLNSFLQPTLTTDRVGRQIKRDYDVKGNLQTLTHALGTPAQAAWTYLYNARGQVTTATDANGKSTDYGYNAAGLLTSVTEPPDVAGGTRAVRTFEYTPAGLLSAAIDAAGRRVTYAYDVRGRLTTTTYPNSTTETVTYGSGAAAGLVVARKNRNGVSEAYEYDASRRVAKTTRASGRPEQIISTFEYLAGTNLLSAETNAGERVEYTYDERLRPLTRKTFVRNAVSLTSQMSWDALDRDIAETDAYGRRTLRVYDVDGRVVRTVRELVPGGVSAGQNLSTLPRISTGNPPYIIVDVAYDPMNQVKSTTDGRGVLTVQTYDGQGRRLTLVSASGSPEQRTTSFEYDPVGNVTRQLDPRTITEGPGFQTVVTYTGRNLPLTRTEASGTADSAQSSYTYTLTGKALTVTDPRAGVTTYGYDTCCDRLTSVKDAGNFTTTYAYDGVGNRTSVTNPLNAKTIYAYDGLNRLMTETNPLLQSTTYQYDDNLTDLVGLDRDYSDQVAGFGVGANANGSAIRVTNATNEKTVSFRDGAGREILHISASGGETSTRYDAIVSGLVETAVLDPLLRFNRRQDDASGAARATIDADARTTTFASDAGGNLLSTRDPNNVGQDCQYDPLGQRKNCTDTQGDRTDWEYDAAGNQTATVDGKRIRTTATYDFRNRRKTATDGLPATTRWAYDGNSNVTSITDGENRVTQYTYDARNLRLTETFPDSTGMTDRVTNTFDAAARLATRIDQGGNQTTYTYDTADRLIRKTDPGGKVDTFTNDAVGRMTNGASQRYGTTVARSFDSAGRLQTESLSPPAPQPTFTVQYGYDTLDRPSTLTYPDGSVVTTDYTARSQVNSIRRGTQSIAQYAYDNAGRVTTTTLGNGLIETKSYRPDDTISALTTPTVGNFSYTYDANKQRLTEGGTAVNGAQTLGYDPGGRLASWGNGTSTQSWSLSLVGDWNSTTRNGVTETRSHNNGHELTAIGATPLTYDPRGNLLTDDVGNTRTWDFENELVTSTRAGSTVSYLYDVLGRKVGRVAGGTTTIFVHAGSEVVAEYVNGALRADYVLGPSIDTPLAYVAGGTLSWYAANPLGSIAAVTSGTGAVLERYRYDAYGARTVLSPSGAMLGGSVVGNQIGYTGRYHDSSSGLIDFRFRQYDPRLGRFISRDDEYNDGMSLYGGYLVPNGRDPSGHCDDEESRGACPTPPPGECIGPNVKVGDECLDPEEARKRRVQCSPTTDECIETPGSPVVVAGGGRGGGSGGSAGTPGTQPSGWRSRPVGAGSTGGTPTPAGSSTPATGWVGAAPGTNDIAWVNGAGAPCLGGYCYPPTGPYWAGVPGDLAARRANVEAAAAGAAVLGGTAWTADDAAVDAALDRMGSWFGEIGASVRVGVGAGVAVGILLTPSNAGVRYDESGYPARALEMGQNDKIRRRWEEAKKKKWPIDAKTGKNQDVSHEVPRADGGTDDLSNIRPRPRDDHMDRHKKAGDFRRWGARKKRRP